MSFSHQLGFGWQRVNGRCNCIKSDVVTSENVVSDSWSKKSFCWFERYSRFPITRIFKGNLKKIRVFGSIRSSCNWTTNLYGDTGDEVKCTPNPRNLTGTFCVMQITKITGLLQNELNVWDSSTQFFFNLSPTDDLIGVIEGEKTRMALRETKIASS